MSKTFCPLPWVHLATHPHGIVSLCCESSNIRAASHSHDLVSDKKVFRTLSSEKFNFERIHNSELFKSVRYQMLHSEIPEPCRKCYDLENAGIESKRVRETKRIKFSYEDALKITDRDGFLKLVNYEFIELRLGNHCNQACRTCNPYSSTKMKQDWIKIHGNFDTAQEKFDWPLDDNFWNKLNLNTQNLRFIYINGGEPLLVDKHKKFLETLIDRGIASNIKIHYSTNGTVKNKVYEDVWKEFLSVDFSISIDDLKNRNNYIRYPSDWKKINEFLEWLKVLQSEKNNINYSILQTVSLMNIFYLKEFYDHFSQQNISISHNFVSDPDYFSIVNLPERVKKIVLDKIKNYSFYDSVKNFMSLNNNKEKFDNFLEITKKFDSIRNQSFKEHFYDYVKIIELESYEE
jgi:organic radical activating enzyme